MTIQMVNRLILVRCWIQKRVKFLKFFVQKIIQFLLHKLHKIVLSKTNEEKKMQ